MSQQSVPSALNKTDPTIEELGIGLIPPSRQTKKPAELFFVWCAANIGILGVVYGAIIVSFGLSFFQSVLAAVVGVASFILVGITSIAGKIGRTTTLTLSRASFGKSGNIAPTAFCWFNLMGWEAVNIITGTLTLAALFTAIGLGSGHLMTAIALILFGGLTVLVSILGQNTVLLMQKWITRIFGAMTLFVVLWLLATADWQALISRPSGNWITGFLPAVSIIAAGTGISWAIAGADYSRDQSPSSSHSRIFGSVVGGAALPLLLLILTGILLTAQLPDLAAEENPIAAIGGLLPSWMAVPYLAAAVAGIVTIAVLSLYSASLNLLSMGIKLKQRTAVALDGVIVLRSRFMFCLFPVISSGRLFHSWCSADCSSHPGRRFLSPITTANTKPPVTTKFRSTATPGLSGRPSCAGSAARLPGCWSPTPALLTDRLPPVCLRIPVWGCLSPSW